MALDQLCEKINKMAKGMIGHAATPAKITAVHAEINVVQRIERAHDRISSRTREISENPQRANRTLRVMWKQYSVT